MDRFGIVNQVGGFIPHPPSTALVFLPLTKVSAQTAKNIWTTLNVILLLANIFLLAKTSGLNFLPTSLLFLCTSYGLLNNFLFGQMYLLLTFSILLGIYFYQKDKMLAAGIAFAALIPVKYFGVLFIVYAGWQRKW